MLALTRRIGETIVIGNDIRITVVQVGPGRVKIGVQAPSNVRVDREEVHARIVEEKSDEPAPPAEAPRAEAAPLLVGDEPPRIYNRIADKLPPEESTPPANRLDPYRRKPR